MLHVVVQFHLKVVQDPGNAFQYLFDFDCNTIVITSYSIHYTKLYDYGVQVKGLLFDTMVAHHLLFPGQKNNMAAMAETMLGYTPVSIESLIGAKGKMQGNMRDVAIAEVKEYAAEDADITWQLYLLLQEKMAESKQEARFYDVESYNFV